MTQMFFDNRRYFDFRAPLPRGGDQVPIIPGMKPSRRSATLEILPETFGVGCPKSWCARRRAHPDDVREIGYRMGHRPEPRTDGRRRACPALLTMSRTTNIQKIVKTIF